MPPGAEPGLELDTLEVYLSNRCNLACGYCFVQVHEGEPAFADGEAVLAAVELFLRESRAPRKAVNLLGGEPLLQFPLLLRVARRARELCPEAVLDVTTNGLLLDSERFAELDRAGFRVTVSLDGPPSTNDAQRPIHGRAGSSHDEALAGLAGLPLGRMGASLVFTPASVDRLLPNLYYLHRLGFGRINFQPEFYGDWSRESLSEMSRQLARFGVFYRGQLVEGRPFVVPMLITLLDPGRRERGWWRDCHSLVLGPEGAFHPCNRAMSLPQARRARTGTGTPAAGVRWEARRDAHRAAAAVVDRALGEEAGHPFCPMGVVFSGRLGEEPDAGLRRFAEVSRVFSEGLEAVLADVRERPSFRKLYGLA